MHTLPAHLGRLAALVLLAGLFSALLLRFSPGAFVDERELDPRLKPETILAIREERAANNSIGRGFLSFFRKLSQGDLGWSASHNAPVRELMTGNFSATARRLATGLAGGWCLGFAFAVAIARYRRAWVLDALTAFSAGAMLSIPAAVLAYFAVASGTSVEWVLVVILAPRVFRFARNLLLQAYGAGHVEMARARGIGEWRIFQAHVLGSAGPQLLALAATSVSMALGAVIPVEVICDAPGLGRLAWEAATARDLPLLVNLTMLIALCTAAAMAVCEVASTVRSEEAW